MDQKEQMLIEQLKEGRESAYKYLFDHHYAVLCHVAFQYTGDQYLSETIVGDVIYNIWRKRDTIAINNSLRSYLMACVRNRCLDYTKSKVCQHEQNVSMLPDIAMVDVIPLGQLLERELEKEVMDSIEKLPDKAREVFKLSRFSDLKYDEIADRMGLSVNTVKYHMKRALALLRESLDNLMVLVLLLSNIWF